jgi:exopolyphosphatase / guanosine-5'-triphosphate,3'-diphosphate pyrophosphatase
MTAAGHHQPDTASRDAQPADDAGEMKDVPPPEQGPGDGDHPTDLRAVDADADHRTDPPTPTSETDRADTDKADRKKKKKAGKKLKKKRLVSVIDIGSTAIRLVIAEIVRENEWSTLDRAIRPLSLGRDVFLRGSLSTGAMREAIAILESFQELLRGWRIAPEDVRVIATAAIREARNRDIFLDRVQVRTGFRINVVEGIEENHLTYIAVQHAIEELRPQFSRSNAMILEVGGGTSELMVLKRGRMVAAHNLGIGTLRVEQQLQKQFFDNVRVEDYLRENIRITRDALNTELRLDRIRFFVAVGGDARTVAERVGTREGEYFSVIKRESFIGFLEELKSRSVEECVRDLKLTWTEAEGLYPALLILRIFLDTTTAGQLIVPDVSIREGVLLSFAADPTHGIRREFRQQVLNSAIGLGRKYHYDEAHAQHVSTLALSIFDQLRDEHGMGEHVRLLLEVAGLLHDIGYFVRPDGHQKHGQYIVENSEIFGLSRTDLAMVGNVVRFHRGASPRAGRSGFGALRWTQRMTVLKMTAILRVADALDRGHAQRVRTVTLGREGDDMVVQCEYTGDISTEQHGLDQKGGMFEEVFGYQVVMR